MAHRGGRHRERTENSRLVRSTADPASQRLTHAQPVERLVNSVLSTQRTLQGVLAGHTLELFDLPARFATGMAVAVALGLLCMR